MEVKHGELFEFKLVFTEHEYNEIMEIMNWLNCKVENAVLATYLRGLFAMQRAFEFKEKSNELDRED